MNQNEPAIEEIRIVERVRIDYQVDRHGTLPNGAHRPYSRGCAQNELAMWVIAKMVKIPTDCHAPLIISQFFYQNGVSSSTLSMWRPLAVVAIATTAGEVWGYSRSNLYYLRHSLGSPA
ncbi:hypothetical protein Y032_0506g2684 [Ancylostoma ceylanicum]|uniref:Uncharacterized protein n=1 Tax=Ancylostoma ceylanicum TaxID=53326 RepID=A0A016WTZ4_9BILA|nr:hypothetical protein Y032_0506g2684 [Ancylostoma ceylanicum]